MPPLLPGLWVAVLALLLALALRRWYDPTPAVCWLAWSTALALLLGAYLLAVAAMATFLGAVLSTPEQAGAVGWISSMVLAGLGGCWWPSEVMPRCATGP